MAEVHVDKDSGEAGREKRWRILHPFVVIMIILIIIACAYVLLLSRSLTFWAFFKKRGVFCFIGRTGLLGSTEIMSQLKNGCVLEDLSNSPLEVDC